LEVAKNANDDDIKKSYRRLAKIWHPDANPDNPASEDKFKEIAEAYDVLSNSDKRQKFDDFISSENKKAKHASSSQTKTGGQQATTNTNETEYSDFFKQFFNQKNTKSKNSFIRGEDVRGKITIDLEEAYLGSVRVLNIGKEKLRLKIKPGIQEDQIIKIPEKGGTSKFGGKNGDLYIRIVVNPHPLFQRSGNDLKMDIMPDIYSLILNEKISIPTIKKEITVTLPAEIEYGSTVRVKGLGMPDYEKPDQFGDLLLTVKYKLPKPRSEKEKTLIKELRKLSNKK